MQYLRWVAYDQGIHPQYGTEHFLVVGASGSGKTIIINTLLQSVFESNRSFRAMVYDPKQEMLPYLYGFANKRASQIKVLHPFDSRSCAWNLAEDIDGPVSARQFATILIPDGEANSGSESFFTNAVRDLLTGVILSFINCVPNPKAWTFRDIILAMLYEPYLRFIIEIDRMRGGDAFPFASRLRDSYLAGDPQKSDPRTTSNIRATINTKLSIYEPVAAVWHFATEAGNTFSLSQWVKEGCNDVLVLGNDEAGRAAIDSINQAIFKRTTELLLANREMTTVEREKGENQTWFFLDEVREAGQLDGLSRLLTKGRSKGACVVLGFQDIDGMRNAYGEETAHEICGQCNNIGILKLNSPSTAEWSTEIFGRRLTKSQSTSRALSSEGGMQMSSEAGEDERPWVYTSDLLYLPTTSPKRGLDGYFRGPGIDPHVHSMRVTLNWQKDIEPYRPKAHPDVKAKEALKQVSDFAARKMRPVSEHYLKPWDNEDWKRLGLDKISQDVISWKVQPTQNVANKKPSGTRLRDINEERKTHLFASEEMCPSDDIGR